MSGRLAALLALCVLAAACGDGPAPRLFVLGIEILQELVQSRPEIVGGVEEHTARAHVAHGDPRSAEHLEKVQYPLPGTEGIHQRGTQSPQVLKEEADAHQVACHTL